MPSLGSITKLEVDEGILLIKLFRKRIRKDSIPVSALLAAPFKPNVNAKSLKINGDNAN